MSASFITNRETFLSDIINGILPKTSQLDILVGYFYYSGYAQISEQLKGKKVRILVGLDVDVNIAKCINEIESLKQTTASRNILKEEYYEHFIKVFNETDILDSKNTLDQFKLFYNKLVDGSLEIRKTLDPCHSKLYLFAYNEMVNEGGELPGVVITGSSNLSYQGLTGRMELNARFDSKNDYLEGKRIFDELWEDSILIVNKDNLDEWNNKVMSHIWFDKLYSPFLMFLRVLKEYFDVPTTNNLLTPYDITDGKYFNIKYQTDAIQMGINALDNHDGAIIADVVGLGKSIIASTIARNLKLRTIIICPPHLYNQWEEYRDEFGFVGSVYSSGKIEEALNHFQNIVHRDEKFLIIVDEAHRFRNEYTEDYTLLHNLCLGNKVLLLTATPFNNQPADIYSLIKLFQIPTNSTLKTVDNLAASFKELIIRYRDLREAQRKGIISEDEVKNDVKSISKYIRSIIDPLVVRRSRLDLLEIEEYKEDLKRQGIQLVIPNDPIELTYDLTQLKDKYLDTLDHISKSPDSNSNSYRFKAARYSPTLYVREEFSEDLANELEDKTGIRFNLLVGRQANVAKFMRHLLVARFESSVAAFQQSLNYMIQSSEHLLRWVEKRNKIPVYKKGNLPDVESFYESSNDCLQEIEDVFDRYESKGFFEIDMKYINDDFIRDVESDIHLLKSLRENWFGKDNVILFDPKIQSFIEKIGKMLKADPLRKIIVFSEYADTVNYLGDVLLKAGLPVMKYTSSDSSPINKEKIRKNFDAGLKSEMQSDDYKILIATDAISEGYNLHRAGTIINYDIPYNPTRVIQRIGRINRINKKVFDELFIYNYFPSDVGEAETSTKEISTLKMAMIHAIMGEDTKALTKDEEVQAYFKERYRREFSNSEEASWDTPYRKLLNQWKGTEAFQQAIDIPHRARTARKVTGKYHGVLLFGKKGNDFVFKIGSKEMEPVYLSAEDAFSLFYADKDEVPCKLSENFDFVYQKVKSVLFKSNVNDKSEKETLKALSKVKLILKNNLLDKDYVCDLIKALKIDALSGYEIRFINKVSLKEPDKILKAIPLSYLDRIIVSNSRIDDSEESLILSEELITY